MVLGVLIFTFVEALGFRCLDVVFWNLWILRVSSVDYLGVLRF